MLKEELQKLVEKAAGSPAALEHPENPAHGDYATSVALVVAKKLGKDPREIAESIVKAINYKLKTINFVEKVEVAGPGFINFFLTKEFFVQELQQIAKQKEAYGKWKEKRRVIIEFTDPNPFKVFHLGHLYDNAVGESLSRLFEATGAKAWRVNYQGDVGLHVAKAILGMRLAMKYFSNSVPKEEDTPSKQVAWLGWCYSLGAGSDFHAQYINHPQGLEHFKRVIDERNKMVEAGELEKINKAVYEQNEKEKDTNKLYKRGRRWSLRYFKKLYKRLGTKFDHYYFESEVGDVGARIVKKGLQKGIFQESQGAVIFPGEKEKYGLHNRVFINSQGLPTYEAKELGLAPTKYKDFKYDLSLIVTGNEIIDYFCVVLAAMGEVYPNLAAKTRHVTHGMVRLPEGKMSSRTGNVIIAENLLDEVKLRVLEIMETSTSIVSKKDRERTAEVIAVGAVKYSLLRVSLGKNIAFDLEKSLSLDGDSGSYLQYTYARCKSIARKAGNPKSQIRNPKQPQNLTREELDILRLVYRFPEVVKEAAEKFSPNLLCNFAFDLAQRYNLFYNTHRVLQAETKEAKGFRLLLTAAVAQLLKNSLSLLGISAPERM